MTLGRLVGCMALATALGCGGGARDLLDTARLEEVQNNPTHAREIYEEIVRKYPESPEATAARDRLGALGSQAGK